MSRVRENGHGRCWQNRLAPTCWRRPIHRTATAGSRRRRRLSGSQLRSRWIQCVVTGGITSINRLSWPRTVTRRPVSRAIFRATFKAAFSSTYSSKMMLPFPENELGFDTLMMITGAFWSITLDQHRRQDGRKDEQAYDGDLQYALGRHCAPPQLGRRAQRINVLKVPACLSLALDNNSKKPQPTSAGAALPWNMPTGGTVGTTI